MVDKDEHWKKVCKDILNGNNEWEVEAEIIIVVPEQTIPGPMDAAELKSQNNPKRNICNVCNKVMVQVRCETHHNAKGCSRCHLNKEHKA